MGQNCQCCISSKRLDIDKAIVAGGNLSEIARNFGVSYSSVTHHRDKHISRQLLTAAKQRDLTTSGGLLDIMENLFQVTNLVVSEAWRQKKLGVCLSGIGKASGIVKIIADMVYQIKEIELRKKEVETPRTIHVTLVDENENEIDTSKLPPVKREMPVHRRSLPEQEPAIDITPEKRFVRRNAKPEQAIKDNPEPEPEPKGKSTDEFEAMRKKHEKPVKVPGEIETFTDQELDEVDSEGLTMRERLRIRPLHERAY